MLANVIYIISMFLIKTVFVHSYPFFWQKDKVFQIQVKTIFDILKAMTSDCEDGDSYFSLETEAKELRQILLTA